MTNIPQEVGNPPAFPHIEPRDPAFSSCQPGMTLRDWFAGQALAGVMPTCVGDTPRSGESVPEAFARKAYEVADAMLKHRADLS